MTAHTERTDKLRIATRALIRLGMVGGDGRTGAQAKLAEHFHVSRQRVCQIVHEELRRKAAAEA